MKYSFILCHRNREVHKAKCIAALKKYGDTNRLDYEIIVVTQDDMFGFRRGALFNEGVKHATGHVLVFHDVDHIPTSNVTYWDSISPVFLPICNCLFLAEDGSLRERDDIPAGYRNFDQAVDENFYGGVITFTRDALQKTTGFNPAYCGWGLEEEDLRERIKVNDLKAVRAKEGTFQILHHPNSDPGANNYRYIHNRDIALRWRDFLTEGIATQIYAKSEVEVVDDKVKEVRVSDCSWGIDLPWLWMNYECVVHEYENTPECHTKIWKSFKSFVNRNADLKAHRDWVIANDWGYGNRAFHWMWNLIFRDVLPDNFVAMEIGVFKGQTISLWSMLNDVYSRNGTIYGVTPLSSYGDKFSKHPEVDYEEAIATIYAKFGLDADDLQIINGLSTDPNIIEEAGQVGELDLLFIDGGHDYPVIQSDLKHYCPLVKIGGLVVIDDASNDLNIPKGLIRADWLGIDEVTQAVVEYFTDNDDYVFEFAVGHNKIYRKVK